MEKKEQIKFLTEALVEAIKTLLLTEVNIRGIKSMMISQPHKNVDFKKPLNDAEDAKINLQTKIGKLRQLIGEIEKGEFIA